MNQIPTSQTTTWDALFRVHSLAEAHLSATLSEAGLPAADACQLLLALSRHAALDKVAAKQLEQELQVPQYGMSRLLDRLEKQNMITRVPNPTDKRSNFIALTETGQKVCKLADEKMEHARSSFFENRIKPGQLDRLTALLSPLLESEQNQ